MTTFGPLGFLSPLVLWGLLVLPLLWILLRAVPPAPRRRRFAPVVLLLGLGDQDAETDRTPWWLLLLRMAAVALLVIGFAAPVLNPQPSRSQGGPLLIVIDGTWADARDWPRRIERAAQALEAAGQAGQRLALVRLSDPAQPLQFQTAADWSGRLQALSPLAWAPPDLSPWAEVFAAAPEGVETLWLSDGRDYPGRRDLAALLAAKGSLTVVETSSPLYALYPPRFEEGALGLRVARLGAGPAAEIDISGRGPDPAGVVRELARITLEFAAGAQTAEQSVQLPLEIRNRLTRFEIQGPRSAGAVSLTDDSLKRRKVALIGGAPSAEGLQLLAPLHYLRQALSPVADLVESGLGDALRASPDTVILADVANLSAEEETALRAWVEKGGLLVRFAGPRLAASDLGRYEEDALMPVRLREGGRALGGAMSWGEPKALQPFAETSPFYGLSLPQDLAISAQILAQPDPDLAARTIAALDDGTPLVTRKALGAGQVVLFHVTANAEWSNLPLSGLFVQMLERLAVASRSARPEAGALIGQIWTPEALLDAYGAARPAGERAGVSGEALGQALAQGPSAEVLPGLYAGKDRRIAVNAVTEETRLAPALWPAAALREGMAQPAPRALQGLALALGLGLLLLDLLAALWVSGRLGGLGRAGKTLGVAALAGMLALGLPKTLRAQEPGGQSQSQSQSQTQSAAQADDDAFAIAATEGVVLAYVATGDGDQDSLSREGLSGLGERIYARTAIEPLAPMAVDLEKDELAFFPFLYWPVLADAPTPSGAAYGKLNQYLRSGGMILFDTRDGDLAGLVGSSPEGQALARLAAGLDIPPLEPIPEDHVLTRTFYLLHDFPGRYAGTTLWVEAAPEAAAEAEEGMPFRNLNDGVTPVVIGGGDWAAAWATDESGMPVLPVGRGAAGERQREMAYRFGVNLIMHVLTGNYKSDQVHVPALLERLGQ